MARKVERKLTAAEERRYAKLREQAQHDFPPKVRSEKKTVAGSIARRLREARETQGMTWYAVAKAAGIPNSGTIRDIEAGRDAKLSNVEAVAKVLGLRLELQTVDN